MDGVWAAVMRKWEYADVCKWMGGFQLGGTFFCGKRIEPTLSALVC